MDIHTILKLMLQQTAVLTHAHLIDLSTISHSIWIIIKPELSKRSIYCGTKEFKHHFPHKLILVSNFSSIPNNSVTHISFSSSFNETVDFLPPSITHITFGQDFNQPVNYLPLNTTRIFFGLSFNQPINLLPPSLTHLRVGSIYSHPLDSLPATLVYFIFGIEELVKAERDTFFMESQTHIWAPKVEPKAKVAPPPFAYRLDNLPPRLNHLSIGESFNAPLDNLPQTVSFLSIGNSFNHPIEHLPAALTQLVIGRGGQGVFDHPINALPNKLVSLGLSYRFNQPVDSLPRSLKRVFFSTFFDHPVDTLPPGLTHLALGSTFNHPIEYLPKTLTSLLLGARFNRSIDCLPEGMTHLIIQNRGYDCPIAKFPPRLVYLSFNVDQYAFNLPIPPSLKSFLCRKELNPVPKLPEKCDLKRI